MVASKFGRGPAHESDNLRLAWRLFAFVWPLTFMVLQPASAASQEAPLQNQVANTGDDFFRPPANLFQTLLENRTAPGSGLAKGSIVGVTTDTLNLRYDHRIDFSPQSELVWRSDLPLVAKNPVSSSNPDGDYIRGLGDADTQGVYIYNLDTQFAVGAGARLTAPTGGDTLGTGKWQIMPIVGMRYTISESDYLEPYARYAVSFAGDPTKKNISNLQLAPQLNLGLPERFFITFYPSADIRVNFGDPVTGQTGRLFLPFDARIGRKMSDNVSISLEVGVPVIKDYPVYNIKTELRLNITF
jgi:hypothetical protein